MNQDQRKLMECEGCGLTLLWPLPTPAELGAYYGPIYFGFGKASQEGKGYAMARRLAKMASSGNFLDVGCATGFLLDGIRKNCDWKVYGVDYGASAVRYCKEVLGLDARLGTLAAAKFKPASFDVIHLNNVIEHELDPLALLKASAKVLKPGGQIWLATPNGAVDRARYRDYLKGWGVRAESQDGHVFFFSGPSLERLAAKAGLSVAGRWSSGMIRGARASGLLPRRMGWYRGFAPRDRSQQPKRPIEEFINEGKRYPKAYYVYKDLRDHATRLPGYWKAGFDFHLLLTKV